MTDRIHKFKVGQTVDLIPSTFRVGGERELRNRQPAAGRGRKYAVSDQEQERSPRARGCGKRPYPFGALKFGLD